MSLNNIEVHIGPIPHAPTQSARGAPVPAPASSATKKMFIHVKDETSPDSVSVVLTDLFTVWEGDLLKCFIQPDGNDSISAMLRDKLTGDTAELIFQLVSRDQAKSAASQYADSSEVLSIKSKFEKGGIRVADIGLRKLDGTDSIGIVREKMDGFLSKAVQERKELEQHLQLMDAQKKHLLDSNQMYCEQLMSKAADREQATLELMKRFLPILNSKKEKIRELMERIRALETGEDERDERVVRSGDEDDGDEDEEGLSDNEEAKRVKSKARLQASKKPPKAQVAKSVAKPQATVTKKQQQAKSELPPALTEPSSGEKRLTRGSLRREASLRASQEQKEHDDNGEANAQKGVKRSILDVAEELADKKPRVHASKNEPSKSAAAAAPTTEDEEGPLPPGWVITTSKSQPGRKCYMNIEQKKKTFVRPRMETKDVPTEPPVKETPPTAAVVTRTRRSSSGPDEEENKVASVLKDFL